MIGTPSRGGMLERAGQRIPKPVLAGAHSATMLKAVLSLIDSMLAEGYDYELAVETCGCLLGERPWMILLLARTHCYEKREPKRASDAAPECRPISDPSIWNSVDARWNETV